MFKINRTKCFKFLGNYCLCFCFDRKNDCKICKTGAKFAYGWCLVSVCSFTSEVWYYLCIQVIPRVSTQECQKCQELTGNWKNEAACQVNQEKTHSFHDYQEGFRKNVVNA